MPLKPTEIIRKLKKLWFEWPFPWWKHVHMIKGDLVIPVPFHWWKELWVWLMSTIITEIWISRDERLAL